MPREREREREGVVCKLLNRAKLNFRMILKMHLFQTCVCVCVSVRERERARASERERERERRGGETLTDAIRARKARAEVNKLKTAKESKQNVSDILNDIIAAVPTESKKKKNREAVARHRSKKPQGIPTKVYNTRSRGRTLNL